MNFLISDFNSPFLWAAFLLLFFGVAELILILVGFSGTSFLDSTIEGFDIEGNIPDVASQIFSFCHIGRLPLLVVVTINLILFSNFGFFIQWCSIQLIHRDLGTVFPSLLSISLTLFTQHFIGRFLVTSLDLERDYTSSAESFVGKLARVTLGPGTFDQATQAKLTDDNGRSQYIMVKSLLQSEILKAHSTILIIEKDKAVFRAIPAPEDLTLESI